MADYWMKLYIEVLEDARMATLPDRLWRRVIEIFLIAKKHNKGGALPKIQEMAWILKMNTDDLNKDLKQIKKTGIIKKIAGGWFVTNFAKRQGPSSDTERKRQQRERGHKQQNYETKDGAEPSRNVTQINRPTEAEAEAEAKLEANQTLTPASAIQPMISRATGLAAIPPAEYQRIEQIQSLLSQYGFEKTEEAIGKAYEKWKNTKRRDNSGTYRTTNMGYIDWAQEILLGNNVKAGPAKKWWEMTQEEQFAILVAGGDAKDYA